MSVYLSSLLLFAFTTYVLVGPKPLAFSPEEPSAALERLYLVAMFLIACVIISRRRELAWRLAKKSWLVWVVIGLCVVSVAWSIHPPATLRRSALLAFLVVSAFAIAVGFDRPRVVGATIMAAAGFVLFVELASAVLMPEFAFAFNGFRGAHLSKNVAGFVMLAIASFSLVWAMTRRRLGSAGVGWGVFLCALVLLVMTQSRTSMGLFVFGALVCLPFLVSWRLSERLGVVAGLAIFLVVGVGMATIGVMGWERADVFEMAFGDPTFSRRTDIWALVSDDIRTRPWLGFGYGSYWDVTEVFDPVAGLSDYSWLRHVEGGALNQAHNGYMDLRVQLGVLGPLVATLVFVRAGYVAFRGGLAAPAKTDTYALQASAFMLIMILLLHNLLEASMFSRMFPGGGFVLLFVFFADRLALDAEAVTRSSRRRARSAPVVAVGAA
ncbi:MAG: O-antigen ligase family protein, partial [Caulobacterales bacterium]|nr:O-antigen ligase family protein [Caulobacterales bacterium]